MIFVVIFTGFCRENGEWGSKFGSMGVKAQFLEDSGCYLNE